MFALMVRIPCIGRMGFRRNGQWSVRGHLAFSDSHVSSCYDAEIMEKDLSIITKRKAPEGSFPPGFQMDIINFLSLTDSGDLFVYDSIRVRNLTVHMMMTEKPFLV